MDLHAFESDSVDAKAEVDLSCLTNASKTPTESTRQDFKCCLPECVERLAV